MAGNISRPLARRRCVPCRAGAPPLSADRIEALRAQISDAWKLVDGHHLQREIRRGDFRGSLALANSIGEIAESQRHHPDLLVSWGRLTVTLFTHAVNGLHLNDFILAALIDELLAADVPGGGGAEVSGRDVPGASAAPPSTRPDAGSSPAVPG